MGVPKLKSIRPAGGADLLDELHATLTRYVVLPSTEAVDSVVLWIAATHALEAFEHATRLAVDSPVKRCGKTRLIEVLGALAYNTVSTTNISVPALFRMIDAADRPPTLLLDEADRLFGSAKRDEENRDLIAVLNNGFRDGNPTWRCVGPQQTPMPFSNYAMAAIAGIGRKPDTIEDRAITVTMRRRMPGETVSKFRLRTDLPALHDLRDRLNEWAAEQATDLAVPVVGIPDELEDRAEDAWEPMLAIADAAGGTWPARARVAAVKLTREAAIDDGEASLETKLLADVKSILTKLDVAFIKSADLCSALLQLEESPWRDLDLTVRKLAYRLSKFGIKPEQNRTRTARGYHLAALVDPFSRYLPAAHPSKVSNPSRTTADLRKRLDTSESLDGSIRPASEKRPDETAGQDGFPDGWTDRTDVPDAAELDRVELEIAGQLVMDVFSGAVEHGTCRSCQQPNTDLVGRDRRDRPACADCIERTTA